MVNLELSGHHKEALSGVGVSPTSSTNTNCYVERFETPPPQTKKRYLYIVHQWLMFMYFKFLSAVKDVTGFSFALES